MTARRKVACLAGLSLPVIAVAYLVLDLVLAARPPSMEDWREAAALVRAAFQDGDVVVFTPAWAHEGAPEFAGLTVELGEETDWYEMSKRKRVWAVGFPGARPEGMAEGSFVELQRFDLDGATVALYEPAPGRPRLLYDFRARLEDARVTRVHKDRREECNNWSDGAWHCGATHPWQNVGLRRMDAGGTMRDVIWAHPLDKGVPLEVRWAAVPLGSTLVVQWGYTQEAIDSEHPGAPVRFTVRLNGQLVVDHVLEERDAAWHEAVVNTSALRGTQGDVVVGVVTPDYRDRQVVFRADTWD